jgi:hypothetical protein
MICRLTLDFNLIFSKIEEIKSYRKKMKKKTLNPRKNLERQLSNGVQI